MNINKLFAIHLMMLLSMSVSAMQIFVEVPVDRTITLDVEQSDSIEDVKAQIEAEEDIPVAQQKLYFGAQELLDGRTLADYNIQDGSTLTLSLQSVFLDITEFENGYLTFPNVDQSLFYRIEFKPNLAESEVWDGTYSGLRNIQSSDPEVTVPVGVFYRVAGRDTPWLGGTARAADILSGETAYVDDEEVTGTMPNVGQQNVMPGTVPQTITQGYHDGTGEVGGDADLAEANIVAGVTIFGVTGTYQGFTLVPKTGQGAAESHRARDDGDLQAGTAWPSPRFTDNGDQTVTDNLTGLMWTKHSNLPEGARSWVDAIDYCTNMNAGSGTYGYTDWRLPNVREMQSLIDYGRDFPALPEGHPFTDVGSGTRRYWSSSTYYFFPEIDDAWYVDLRLGRVDREDKAIAHYVWPVRSGL